MKYDITNRFSDEIFDKWIDSEYEVDISNISANGWSCVIAPDFINAMESEWLSESIRRHTSGQLVGISFEYGGRSEVQLIEAERDAILEYNSLNSYKYVIITSEDEEFVYYKDQSNRFFLVSGTPEFINDAYKCSLDTLKVMFFNWLEDDLNSDSEKRYLIKIWEKYMSKGTTKLSPKGC